MGWIYIQLFDCKKGFKKNYDCPARQARGVFYIQGKQASTFIGG